MKPFLVVLAWSGAATLHPFITLRHQRSEPETQQVELVFKTGPGPPRGTGDTAAETAPDMAD